MELRLEKISKFKIILILIFIFSCLPIVFLYTFLRDFSFLSVNINNYIQSGSSLFFPMLPVIDFFAFLPSQIKICTFTLGHLLDIIIIANIVFYSESLLYHYIKSVFLSSKGIEYVCDLDMYLNTRKRDSTNPSNESNEVIKLESELEKDLNQNCYNKKKDFILLFPVKSIHGKLILEFLIYDLTPFKGFSHFIKRFEEKNNLSFHTHYISDFFNLIPFNILLFTDYPPEEISRSDFSEYNSGLINKLTFNELNYYLNQNTRNKSLKNKN